MTGAGTILDRKDPVPVPATVGDSVPGRLERGGWAALPPFLVAAVVILLPAYQGGYFPVSWGWSALALLWVVGLWAILARRAELGRLDLAFLLALAAFLGWTGLSLAWSQAPAQSMLEVQRGIVYVAGLAAFLALARRRAAASLAGAAVFAITLVSAYGLATRLFPDRLGVYDPVAVYRLAEPIGYWNGLGIFAAMGTLLALGVAAHGRRLPARMGASAALAILLSTLYFTYSRASWIALGLGLALALAVSTHRLRLATTALLAAPAPAASVWLASQSPALTRQGAALADAAQEGRRLALLILGLAAAGALAAGFRAVLEGRVAPTPALRRAYGAVLLVALAAGAATVFVRFGSPPALAERGYRAFTAPPPRIGGDLNQRLFSFSGNGRADLWQVAWAAYEGHPWLGTGAGTFERHWLADARSTFKVRDAHGLYLETLSELGPVGLGLLALALVVPLGAGLRSRTQGLVPPVLGAYAAFLVHAGVDWDWELAGVTLTALLLGGILVVSSRPDGADRPLRARTRAAALAVLLPLSAAALVGLVGNGALASAEDAIAARRWSRAESEARQAERWMPWSTRPLILRGQAQLGAGDPVSARATFRQAVARDPGDWQGWLGLALAGHGRERSQAIRRAHLLNRHHAGIARLYRSWSR